VQDYKNGVSRLNNSPPPFKLDIRSLSDAVTHTMERMRTIIRKAQKDIDFAKIYELHKTNKLLTSGFSTLGQTVNELQDCLVSSLNNLSSSVSRATSNLLTQMKLESLERREHEREEREMLDNIQRKRKPSP
jgi:hypothetical protein